MYKKIMRYGRGHITIEVRGENPELFLNEALGQDVVFFDTHFDARKKDKVLYAGVTAGDFPKLRAAARQAKVEVRIRRKRGIPFVVSRWGKRRGLILGGVLIVLAVLVLSQFVLSVSVTGNRTLDTQRVVTEADKVGIRPWVYRGVLDKKKLEKQLVEALPECTWVSIEERGTDVLISVVEKALPPQVVFRGDLVAARAGLVEEIMLIQGTAQVKEGDTVRQGQVLIGAEAGVKVENLGAAHNDDKEGLQPPVAKGFVRGRTWYSAEAVVPLRETVVSATQRQKNGWGIKVGERVIMITQAKSPYEESFVEKSQYRLFSWRNWEFPVEMVKVNYQETEAVALSRDPEQALSLAVEQASAELEANLPAGAEVLRQDSVVLPAEEGFVRIRVQVEVFEELAVYEGS
ncbi:MAG: sporulation protein YqfD [Peptococcaceae bacterium]|nr:sporulation protein YqfD [Peptococcaceae bacterium]